MPASNIRSPFHLHSTIESDLDNFSYEKIKVWGTRHINTINDRQMIKHILLSKVNNSALYSLDVTPLTADDIHEIAEKSHGVPHTEVLCQSELVRPETLWLLAKKHSHSQALEAIYRHKNTPSELRDLLHEKVLEKKPHLDNVIALENNTELLNLVKGDDTHFNIDAFAERLFDFGIMVEGLADVKTPKALCKAIIGTAHHLEVEMLFCYTYSNRLNGLSALTNLQVAFTDRRKRKVDRHNYLKFLGLASQGPSITWLAYISGEQLKTVIQHLGPTILIQINCASSRNQADIVRMLADILSADDSENQYTKRKRLLYNWLERYNDYGTKLHEYLSKKSREKLRRTQMYFDFNQAKYQSVIAAINAESTEYDIYWPHNTDALIDIGKKQKHCVGSRHYANLLHQDIGHIFSIIPTKNGEPQRLSKGFTFQFDEKGTLVQAKGMLNSDVSQKWVDIAFEVMEKVYGEV